MRDILIPLLLKQVYYARYLDPVAAQAAVRKHLDAGPNIIVRAKKRVSANAFEARKIKSETLSLWWGYPSRGRYAYRWIAG
jgi:hypothetical protein